MTLRTTAGVFTLFLCMAPLAAAAPPEPFGAVPSEPHLRWHELEYYGFIHFTINTFTDREWGGGDESPGLFNPSACDPEQWARVAAGSGMKGLILTAKHHDGFCLWPSKYTQHSVQASPWKGGKGDLVGELAAACKKHGLLLGLYLSPWDRNHAEYGRPAYIDYYRNQWRELLTRYGPIFETWYDGANGGSGYYGGANETRRIDNKTYYDWIPTWKLVRDLQPGCIRFSDGGPDIRWVGNEQGLGYDPNWCTFNRQGRWPGVSEQASLWHGDRGGTDWVPAEVDVSIRPGWFWHESQNDKVKTLDQLLEIYYASVGRGCNLLLNVPPDRRGLFHEIDVERLQELGNYIKQTFASDLAKGKPAKVDTTWGDSADFTAAKLTDGDRKTYWAAADEAHSAVLEIDLGGPTTFDNIRIEEFIPLGQRVEAFEIDARSGGEWKKIAEGFTIGPRRILRTERVAADAVRVRLVKCLASPTISTVEVYNSPQR